MSEHERIWLEPACCAESDTGRTWCQDPDNWEHDTFDEPGHDTPTEYVRVDLFAELETQIEAVKLLLPMFDGGIEYCKSRKPERADGIQWAKDKLAKALEVSNEYPSGSRDTVGGMLKDMDTGEVREPTTRYRDGFDR